MIRIPEMVLGHEAVFCLSIFSQHGLPTCPQRKSCHNLSKELLFRHIDNNRARVFYPANWDFVDILGMTEFHVLDMFKSHVVLLASL